MMSNPAGESMYGRLLDTAAKYPQHTALDYYGSEKTYARLVEETGRLAAFWRECGVQPGDRVIICLPNIPQTVVAFYSLNLAGAVPCMVHPLSTAAELEYYIKDSGSKYLVMLDMFYPSFRSVAEQAGIVKTVIARVDEELPAHLRLLYYLKQGRRTPKLPANDSLIRWPDALRSAEPKTAPAPHAFGAAEPALILFSGGTTGTPKGVLLSNGNMNALAFQVLSLVQPEPEKDAMLCILPFFHGFGLGVCLHPVLLGGGRCILVPRFGSREFAVTILNKKPTYIAGVPTLFKALLGSRELARADLSFLKGAYCGGDVVPPALIKEFNRFVRARGGSVTLREGYGLTECVTACSIMPADEYRPGSAGLPFAGTRIRVVDPDTLVVQPPGSAGEICVSGPTVMLGYHGRAAETARTLRRHPDGEIWLHTGDLGYLDADGFLYFRQRYKRIIKRSGYSVYPSQVEDILNSHPDVRAACVIGVPDPYTMQKIKAFVVYKGSLASPREAADSLLKYAAERLIKWSVPDEIEFCAELPLTRLGKIAHLELEKREQNRHAAGGLTARESP